MGIKATAVRVTVLLPQEKAHAKRSHELLDKFHGPVARLERWTYNAGSCTSANAFVETNLMCLTGDAAFAG